MSLTSLNFVDYLVLSVLIGSGILATLRGLTRELLGLAGWLVAIISARLFQPTTITFLEEYINEDSVVESMGWFLPFVITLLAWFVFANITSPSLKKVTLGNLDRLLGFLFGAMRGVVVVAIIYVGVLVFTESEESFPDPVLTSASIAPVRITAIIMTGFAPDNFRKQVQKAIPDQDLDDIKKGFSDQTDKGLDQVQDSTEGLIDDAQDGDLRQDEQIILLPDDYGGN
jgi:membrane protein required for colicin V production